MHMHTRPPSHLKLWSPTTRCAGVFCPAPPDAEGTVKLAHSNCSVVDTVVHGTRLTSGTAADMEELVKPNLKGFESGASVVLSQVRQGF